ncbi:hypothetical protein IWQ56_005142 [Coemansia nantahalensis]|nr:hypothetical protein IWQ56_005142 [Coemansia nantahalensis]
MVAMASFIDDAISAVGGVVNDATAAIQSVASRVEDDFNAGNTPHSGGPATVKTAGVAATAALAAAAAFAQLI